MPKREQPICSKCKSTEVLSDAYAVWDLKQQYWVLQNTFNKGSYCNKCDGECRLEWRTLT